MTWWAARPPRNLCRLQSWQGEFWGVSCVTHHCAWAGQWKTQRVNEETGTKKGKGDASASTLMHCLPLSFPPLPFHPFPCRHEGPVWQVAWAHPSYGTLLASCGYDRRVLIQREVAAGAAAGMAGTPTASGSSWVRILSYDRHKSSVNSVSWAPHELGLVFASASSDGTVAVVAHREDDSWAETLLEDCSSGSNAVSWAPSAHLGGKSSVAPGSTVSLSSSSSAGPSSSSTLTAGPSGVLVTRRLATAGCDGTVRVYKSTVIAESTAATVGAGSWGLEHSLTGVHKDWVRDVAWSPGSGLGCNLMASCSEDGTVVIWKQQAEGGAWKADPLPLFPAPVWRVSWSTTGNLLAVSCGDNSVTIWKESLQGGQWQQVSGLPEVTAAGAVSGMAGMAAAGAGAGGAGQQGMMVAGGRGY